MADDSKPKEEEASDSKDFAGGEVLFCGATDWAMIGRQANKPKKGDPPADPNRAKKYPNLVSPTRLTALQGVKVTWIAAGPAAFHSVIGSDDGRCFTWGRNEKGQLGHGDLQQRNAPTEVAALKGMFITVGACGKSHTAVAARSGEAYTWGSNLVGQCGTGSIKSKKDSEELIRKPHKVDIATCTKVACGSDFTIWLVKQRIFTAGNPQYGQLGHGTDHETNTSHSSIKIVYDPQPTPRAIASLAGVNITAIAAGHNHALAVDDAGYAYAWGNGGYGRVGHNVQQDEFSPKRLEALSQRVKASPDSKIACGSTSSFCTTNISGQLYAWGKLKVSGDNTMYPRPFDGLMGWDIRAMACGAQHFAVSASYQDEHSTITWGHATSGELGYGPGGKKSSAQPDKVQALEGAKTHMVAAGQAHTLFLVDPASLDLDKLETWECETAVEDPPAAAAADGAAAKGSKRKGAASGGAAKKGRK